jgi:hypothetical protein
VFEQLKIFYSTIKQDFVEVLLGIIGILGGLLWFESSKLKRVQIQLIQTHYDGQTALYDQQVGVAEDSLAASEARLKKALDEMNGPNNAA